MYIKFDFEKFEQSRFFASQTLDSLDALDGEITDFEKFDKSRFIAGQTLDGLDTEHMDFAKYCSKLNDIEKELIEERAAIIEFDGQIPRIESESIAIEGMKSITYPN